MRKTVDYIGLIGNEPTLTEDQQRVVKEMMETIRSKSLVMTPSRAVPTIPLGGTPLFSGITDADRMAYIRASMGGKSNAALAMLRYQMHEKNHQLAFFQDELCYFNEDSWIASANRIGLSISKERPKLPGTIELPMDFSKMRIFDIDPTEYPLPLAEAIGMMKQTPIVNLTEFEKSVREVQNIRFSVKVRLPGRKNR